MSTRLSKSRRKGKSRTPYKYHLTREQIIKKNRNIDEQLEEAVEKKPCGGCGSESSDHDQGCPTVPDKKLSVDELVEKWHTGGYDCSLEEHLGWTKQEYSDYVASGSEPEELKKKNRVNP